MIIRKFRSLYKWLRDESVRTVVKPSFVLNNNSGGSNICFVLAGYKEYLWDIVFKRLKTFCPDTIEVCILSSGIYSDKLRAIASSNSWSYLAFKNNCITQVLNSAIYYYHGAQNIYKLDEDVFLTKNCFEFTFQAYHKSKDKYFPVFSAPLIPINGFGYSHILSLLGKIEDYSARFEPPKICAGVDQLIESSPSAAIYMWNDLGKNIDEINYLCNYQYNSSHQNSQPYLVCPIRFSIGFIFFERKTIDQYGFFPVKRESCLGLDEIYLCSLSAKYSRAIIVANNTVVGHLSFGEQNKVMKDFYLSHQWLFDIQDNA